MPPDALRANALLLSDDERLQIALGASSLFERLDGTGLATTPDGGQHVLEAWAHAFSPGDPEAFARRLSWDGLDAAAVRRRLTEPAAQASHLAPGWTAWLNRFLEESAAFGVALERPESGVELTRLAPAPEAPFLEIWVAMARCARRAVAEAGETLEGISPAACAAFERSLVAELSGVGELVLYRLFRDFKQARGRSGSCYGAFVRRLLEGGLAGVFTEYPVLARQLAILVATWLESTLELLARLRGDRDAIAATFGAQPLGELCHAAPKLSDRHEGGRCVAALTFGSGLTVVYKPRGVGLEHAFQGFQAWLAGRGLGCLPRPLRVLEREGYGWVEWVGQETFQDRQQVREYYRRAGGLLCVLHILRGTDVHQENVVATRLGPVLVDAETLLQPVDHLEEADARTDGLIDGAANGVPRSCLSSGFVTLLQVDADDASYDVGGLMPAAPRTLAVGQRSWRSLRSDELHYVAERRLDATARNQVVWDGVPQRPEWFAADLRSGFADAYRFVLAQRPQILDPQGPLSVFAAQRSRILFRPSDQYGVYLHALAAPRYQKSGMDRSVALESLNQVFRHERERPLLWPLVADERRALEQLDVPRYLLPVEARVLTAANGERVGGYLVDAGLDAVVAGLHHMSAGDLEEQIQLLDSALDALAPQVDLPPNGTEPASNAVSRLEPEATWIRAAEFLGEAVLDSGQRGGALSWRDCDSRGPLGRYDLYRGQSGIALFLAALAAVTGRAHFARAASSLLQPLETLLEERGPAGPESWPSIGACSGVGSVVYTLVSAARLLADTRWTELAIRWAQGISPARIQGDLQLDVAGGTAGALLALLLLEEEAPSPQLRDRVRDCARRLLEAQVATGDDGAAWSGRGGQPLAGFAHGAAGIAYALSRVYVVTSDTRLRQAVRRAHRHERRLFAPAVRNWPALHRRGAALMTAWCHGAPGIGLARALGLEAFRDEEILEEIRIAMETTASVPSSRIDHLCCGNMGRSETLLMMGSRLQDARGLASAAAIATRLAERVCAEGSAGARTEGFEHRTFHPGFFRGLSGIGYQLLRSAAPSRLPSILGFASSQPAA